MGTITLHVMKFSDYAVAYDEKTQGDDPCALIAVGLVAGTVVVTKIIVDKLQVKQLQAL